MAYRKILIPYLLGASSGLLRLAASSTTHPLPLMHKYLESITYAEFRGKILIMLDLLQNLDSKWFTAAVGLPPHLRGMLRLRSLRYDGHLHAISRLPGSVRSRPCLPHRGRGGQLPELESPRSG